MPLARLPTIRLRPLSNHKFIQMHQGSGAPFPDRNSGTQELIPRWDVDSVSDVSEQALRTLPGREKAGIEPRLPTVPAGQASLSRARV